MQVTRKLLDGEDMQELKIKFYKLMIEYHCLSEKDAFEIAQHYHQIYDTAIIKVMEKIHQFTWLLNSSCSSVSCLLRLPCNGHGHHNLTPLSLAAPLGFRPTRRCGRRRSRAPSSSSSCRRTATSRATCCTASTATRRWPRSPPSRTSSSSTSPTRSSGDHPLPHQACPHEAKVPCNFRAVCFNPPQERHGGRREGEWAHLFRPVACADCRYPLAQLPEIEAHASLNQYGPELAKHWSTELRTRVIQVNKTKPSRVQPFISGLLVENPV